jgi:hypothetical protein
MARTQHAQKRDEANAEIRGKIYRQVKRRVDRETGEQLSQASSDLQTKLLEPVRRLRLDPKIIDAQTTDERFTMRIRLAGEDQLGSHTPRPRAPSDSLLSFQLHESVLNNALHRLELDGKTFALPELSHYVARRLNREKGLPVDPEHEDVSITFPPRDSVTVRCEDGRMVVTLAIEKLKKARRVWRDFQVEAFYRPECEGVSAKFVRDGVIRLSGERLRLSSQIALRGIFVQIFSKRRPLKLTPGRIADNPKLADLQITQLAIEDGWIGVAVGPQRIAPQPKQLTRR